MGKAFDASSHASGLTISGVLFGKTNFAAPDQTMFDAYGVFDYDAEGHEWCYNKKLAKDMLVIVGSSKSAIVLGFKKISGQPDVHVVVVSPCHALATPCHATPRRAAPCRATPRYATPCHATPRRATPRYAPPQLSPPHPIQLYPDNAPTVRLRATQMATLPCSSWTT